MGRGSGLRMCQADVCWNRPTWWGQEEEEGE